MTDRPGSVCATADCDERAVFSALLYDGISDVPIPATYSRECGETLREAGEDVRPLASANPDHPLYLKPVILRGTVVEVFGDTAAMVELADENGQTIELVTVPLDQVALDEKGRDR
jgi:hypothetical protein